MGQRKEGEGRQTRVSPDKILARAGPIAGIGTCLHAGQKAVALKGVSSGTPQLCSLTWTGAWGEFLTD